MKVHNEKVHIKLNVKKFFAMLICACMVGTSMPAESYASTAVGAEGVQPLSSGESEAISDEEYGRAVQIGAERISNPVERFAMNEEGNYIDGKYLIIGPWDGIIHRKYFIPSDYIYMGVYNGTPIKWRVLDANKANDASTAGMFILSENALYDDVSERIIFNENKNGDANANIWQGSYAKSWCTEFAKNTSVFYAYEQAAMFGVDKTDEMFGGFSKEMGKSQLTSAEKVFFMSAEELADYVASWYRLPGMQALGSDGSPKDYWLRSPSRYDNTKAMIADYAGGSVIPREVTSKYAVRPATNISKSNILYIASDDTSEALGLYQVPNASAPEWRLIFSEGSRDFRLDGTKNVSAEAGQTVSFAYKGAKTGENEYISVMIMDGERVEYYGRVKKASSSSGTVSFEVPNLPVGSYDVKIFNEQYNGNKRSGASSAFAAGSLTVQGTAIGYAPGKDGSGRRMTVVRTDSNPVTLKGAVYTRELFRQVGWATSDGGPMAFDLGARYTNTGSVTLYPVWERCGNTITYDFAEGNPYAVSIGSNVYVQAEEYPSSYMYGKGVKLPAPVREEYEFTGWSGTIGSKTYTGIYEIPADAEGEARLTASWKTAGSYKLTLNFAGGKLIEAQEDLVIPEKYTAGRNIALPTLTGSAKFRGWSGTIGDKEYKYIYFIPATASGDVNLTAQFGNAFVNYHPGKDGIGEDISELNSSTYNLRDATYTREGYVQVGWSLTDGGEKRYDLKAPYTIGDAIDLYPVWGRMYVITYSAGYQSTTEIKAEGIETTLKGETFKKAGCRQSGWTRTLGGDKEFELGGKFNLDADITLYPSWSECKYDIVYDTDGGEFETETPISSYDYFDTTKLPRCTKPGYQFLGWCGKIGDIEIDTPITSMPLGAEGTAELKAQWKQDVVYDINYNLNQTGAQIDAETYPKQYTIGKGSVKLPNAIRLGYKFLGWSGSIGSTNYTKIMEIPSDAVGDASLSPEWEKGFVVTYAPDSDTEGSAVKDTKYNGVDLILRGAEFTHSGYMQVGWSTSDGGETVYELGDAYIPDADITLYPTWAEGYTITYRSGSDVGSKRILQTVEPGQTAELRDIPFIKAGASQIGWATEENGGKIYDLGAEYKDGIDITLYPAWDTVIYTITYALNGGSIADTEYATEYVYGAITELPKIVTRSGHTFLGWYEDSSYTKKKEKLEATDSGNKTLYARWERDSGYRVNISTKIEHGTIVANPTRATAGTRINLIAIPDEGYRYKTGSWKVSPTLSGDNKIIASGVNAHFNMPGNIVTVACEFVEIKYCETTFNANGGVGTMESQTYPDGQDATLPPNRFTREGYTFIGWNRAPDGSGIGYTDCAEVTITAKQTLYAQWIEKDKDLDFNLSALSAVNVGKNDAELTFTASKAGTYYYILSKKDDAAPQSISDFALGRIIRSGYEWKKTAGTVSGTMTEGTNSIFLSELDEDAEYTLYLAAVGENGDVTTADTVLSCSFTTSTDKLAVTVSELPVFSGIYGQRAVQMTLTGGKVTYGDVEIPGTWKVTDKNKTDIPTVETSKTYDVTFTPDDSRYRPVIRKLTPIVAKKKITVKADSKERAYGESDPEFTFTISSGTLVSGDQKSDLGITLSCAADSTSPVKAGGYAITGASSSANYDVTITAGVLTINKANGAISGTEAYTKSYGDSTFALDAASNHSESELKYTVKDSKDSSGTVTANDKVISVDENGNVTIKAAGSATVTISQAASTNYNAAQDKTVSIIVNKSTGYTVDDINRAYVYVKGGADTIDLSPYLPSDCGKSSIGTPQKSGNITYKSEPAVSETKILSYTAEAGAKGSKGSITVKVTSDNYADYTVTVNLELIDRYMTKLGRDSNVTTESNTLTYGEKLSKLEFNDVRFEDEDGNEVAGVLSWKEPSTVPNVGTKNAVWIFKPNDIAYAEVEGNIRIEVNKATLNVSELPTVSSITYHPDNILTDNQLIGGVVKGVNEGVISGTWSWADSNILPTISNNGYEAIFTPASQADRDNYDYSKIKKNIAVRVNKRVITVKADDKEKTYGEANPELTITLPEGTLTGSEKLSDLGITLSCAADSTSPVKAGGYAITGASSSANYDVTITAGVLTINKVNGAISGTEAYTKSYGDSTFALDAASNHSESELKYTVKDSKDSSGTVTANDKVISVDENGNVTIKAAGSATVTISQAASTNYNAAQDKTVSIVVNRYGNAPNMPESTMKATSECKTVGELELPEGWIWNSEDIEKAIKAGGEVSATAEYIGAGSGNYATESVTIQITGERKEGAHGGGAPLLPQEPSTGTDSPQIPGQSGGESGQPGGSAQTPSAGTDNPQIPGQTGEEAGQSGTATGASGQTEDIEQTAAIKNIKEKVSEMSTIARSSKTAKGGIKISLKIDSKTEEAIKAIEKMGYIVKYRFYRSTKKSASYSAKITKTGKTYTNTSGKKGTKYYYKARIQVFDKNGRLVAQTELKQCRYASRTWSK